MGIQYRKNNQPYAVEITDIISTSESTITARLKKTGKAVVIRRDLADIYGRRMFLPYWLAQKILNQTNG